MINKKKSIKDLAIIYLIILLIILSVNLFFPDIKTLIDSKTLDLRFQFRNLISKNPELSSDIIYVNIDDYSFNKSGKRIWKRDLIAHLLNKTLLGKPNIVAIDIVFDAQVDTTGTNSLLKIITRTNNIVIPFVLNFSEEKFSNNQWFYNSLEYQLYPQTESKSLSKANGILFAPPISYLDNSRGAGFVNFRSDSDGIVRRLPLLVGLKNKLVPSFFFRVASLYMDFPFEKIKVHKNSSILVKNGHNSAEKLIIPMEGKEQIIINYAGPISEENYPNSFSAWDVLHTSVQELRSKFEDKTVLLSDISTNANDSSLTPFGKMSNSYILGNAVNTIIKENFLQQSNVRIEALIMILIAIIILFLAAKSSVAIFNVIAPTFLIALYLISQLLFIQFHYIVNFGFIALEGFLLIIFSNVYFYNKGYLENPKAKEKYKKLYYHFPEDLFPDDLTRIINYTYGEILISFNNKLFLGSIIMCGKLIETLITLIYIKEFSEKPKGLGFHAIRSRLKKKGYSFHHNLDEQMKIINSHRNISVHGYNHIPTNNEAEGIIYLTIDVMKKVVEKNTKERK